ncbi:hypothetical protein CON55_10175 [Bacillus toyonensis]|nr:hypothetical protein CON55_10175 [Bacillus toyonensis]
MKNFYVYIGTYFYPLLFRKTNEYTIGCVYEYECSHYNETVSFKQFFYLSKMKGNLMKLLIKKVSK